jgi:hypothetical protein
MKWFFALNEACPTFSHYANMVKVAVRIAVKQTLLAPHFLYEGADNTLTDCCGSERYRSSVAGRVSLVDSARSHKQKQDPKILAIGAGLFGR